MKCLLVVLYLLFSVSTFAAVHCDNSKGTRLHSSEELNIGTKAFSTTEECSFAAFIANQAGTDLACAPYADRNVSGYSVYRLEDGRDMGFTVFKDLNECNLSVTFSFKESFCVEYDGEYYFWDVEINEPFADGPFPSLKSCIMELGEYR